MCKTNNDIRSEQSRIAYGMDNSCRIENHNSTGRIIHGDFKILTLFNAEWYETVPPFDSVDEILVRRIQTFSR